MSKLILLAVILVLGGWLMGLYNHLVRARNLIKNAFAQIDVQLKRRYDLIPNLVETSKGYLKHEKETLENVIKARNQAWAATQNLSANPLNAEAMKNFSQAEGLLSSSLGRLMAVSESYPELKGHSVMTQLMEELTSTENKISFARQAFNDAVMDYNNKREMAPNNIIASFFQFAPAVPFEIEDPAHKENIKVNFT